MQKKPVYFNFVYPVKNDVASQISGGEPFHVGDLIVNAVCYRYEDGSLLLDDDNEKPFIDFDGIMYEDRNVTLLLETVAEDTYNKIMAKAQKVAEKYDSSIIDEQVDVPCFGELMARQTERPHLEQ